MVSATRAAAARRRAELRLTDTCTISREVKAPRPNPATGKHDVELVKVYAGICEFVAANTAVREVTSQGRVVTEQGAVLKIPVDAPGSAEVAGGMIAEVRLGSHDAASAPLRVRVTGGHRQTFAVSRRLPVEVTNGA
jgi:hypothetical protein